MSTQLKRTIRIVVIAAMAALCLIAPSTAEAAIAVDATNNGSTSGGSSITIPHTTSGSNRLMLVGVSINNDNLEEVLSVTWKGTENLTLDGRFVANADDARVEIWSLVAPSTGTGDVVITFTVDGINPVALLQEAVAGVVTFTGVDQGTPLGTFASAQADDSTPATVPVPSAAGEMVFGVVATEYGDPSNFSGLPDEHWNESVPSTYGAGGTDGGAAPNVTMSWDVYVHPTNGNHWAIGGVSIKPAATNNPPSAPQSPWCEGSTNPTGVTDLTPEFSAIYDDPDTSDTAEYYEIEVDTASTFDGTRMWDTGKTALTSLAENTRMPDVSYAGTPLSEDGSTYYWRIRFWDNSDAQGAWSAIQHFTMDKPGTVKVWVSQDSDDAEENKSGGSMSLTSSDLELSDEDGITPQWIGMRFQNILVPQGATITNAYVQFAADTANSGATNLTVYGEDIGTAPTFTSTASNISSRTRTSATVSWDNVPAWNSPPPREQGVNQRTPNISSIIEEIVGRGDWASGNDLVIIIDGTVGSEREAESWNGANGHGNLSLAPYIHIEYSVAPPTTVYRSIGTNTGTLYNTGNASIDSGTTTVTFGNGASLPVPSAVGAVGQGDKLIIGSETFYILSRDDDTHVTVQTAATSTHTN
ncbi:MAG: glycoside hydrolase family 78 protein, partial [Planctomycetota bacterium]